MAIAGDEWTQVSRRQRKPPESPSVTTMFVSNLPMNANKGDLWRLFGNFGELSNVYIAQKKDANRRNFAFIRFKNVRNRRFLEVALQNLSFAGRNLEVNVAKFERKLKKRVQDFQYRREAINTKDTADIRSNARDGRTFAVVVAGCELPPPLPPPVVNPISLHPNDVMADWIENELTYMGEAISMEHVHNLNPGISMGDDEAFSMKYAGGLKVCLSFRSVDDVNAFLRVKDDWFLKLSRANQYHNHFDRVTSVKIYGHLLNVSVLEYEEEWLPQNSSEFEMIDEDEDQVDFSDDDDNFVGVSDTVMIEDEVDDIEEREIVGDDTEKVEDYFRGITNEPGESQLPLGKSPLVVNNENSKIDNLNSSDNNSFGELKNLIPNGCFGPFNSKWVSPSNGGPEVDKTIGLDFGKLNEAGHLDTLGPDLDFIGSYSKRRKIKNNDLCDRNFPPPPNFESEAPQMDTQIIKLNKSPSNPASNNVHLDPTIISIPEIVRTTRIGRSIGFDIDEENMILIEAMDETGACNHTR
ncbi:unnamed protein product [Lactuca saligna]|uniref:RRM domain-containing protein n=1 Tax=Lactuca saligna TaxID=75948 RepID=A0AA35ZN45_LACSI|nr:unnamed protein product [Lactuca saligna]